ncbi:PQQ-binding-like beta-propeller repeat protein [Bacillus sp. NEB1478]|uniref:outer membrane protein assembly factor BamB family protein n=1 Tax=Bacillus sp. NEB1478 TaxID=3073816 RepID=UPI0028735B09|nr:PQQ-binding-like beta-propeller repeat protein [Bacillus sp. NEB1478]WNB92512.1 PQQ-binding-like beta-propeller repeat protein [Bacillus sp. NEB1478]
MRTIQKILILTLLMISFVLNPTVSSAAVKKSTFYYPNNKNCGEYCSAKLSLGADGSVYEVFSRPEYGRITALSSSGKMKFSYMAAKGIFPAYFPAAASNKTVYSSFSKDNYRDGAILAINEKGNKIWQYNVTGGVPSKPVVGKDGTIYFGQGNYTEMYGPYNSSYLYALTPQGKLKWKVKLAGDTLMSDIQIDKNGTLYIDAITMDDTVMLYAITSKGKVKWLKKNAFRPQIGNNSILHYLDGKGNVVAEDLYGKKKWSYKVQGYPEFKVDQQGMVYVKNEKSLVAISNGMKKWSKTIETGGMWNSDWLFTKTHLYLGVDSFEKGSKLYRFELKMGKTSWATQEKTRVNSLLIDSKGNLISSFNYGKTFSFDF